ncbi:Aste57867_4748 [Aphanomyces stellatus]|uniref:Aste57867_4748 protein n=1 Tax=Aphanomyces stellatus TaxID=120398 RepID=A0A485KH05_9STRA|nr:hypothetical protein As57867_004735 [Aphanomyces stellatus]VFT81844.1 Aste57867_4748 [Aphanomyces stellatus]
MAMMLALLLVVALLNAFGGATDTVANGGLVPRTDSYLVLPQSPVPQTKSLEDYIPVTKSLNAVFQVDGSWQGSNRLLRKSRSDVCTFKNGICTPVDVQVSNYPVIPVDHIAPGYVGVDVEIVNDKMGVAIDTLFFAGHTSINIISNNTVKKANVIAPQVTWALAWLKMDPTKGIKHLGVAMNPNPW